MPPTSLRAAGWVAVALALLAGGAAAQPEVAFQQASYVDEFREDGVVKVRGRVIAGLRFSGQNHPQRLLLAPIAEDGTDALCVRVITSDGLYAGRSHYTLDSPAAPAGAIARLPYLEGREFQENPVNLAAYEETLEGRGGDFATLITPGDCPGEAIRTVLVGLWSDDGKRAATPPVELLVNGMGASDVRVTWESGQGRRLVRCVQSQSGRRVGFDFTCPLAWEPGAAEYTVTVTLRELGMVTGRAHFRALLP
ncbi:hypothetical protein DEM34_15515 [Spiribacter halobius]|uniref:DUF3108 domain-containing protein n=1 Tax=Sediminicurvatus halobius TaxID=2182432 RepID=A0A2U2MXK2_9GAMM|nr:hypothetical protein DEM34_15515 [Spiribacter halobius]